MASGRVGGDMVSADTKITLVCIVLAAAIAVAVGTLTGNQTLAIALLLGVGVVVPRLLSEYAVGR